MTRGSVGSHSGRRARSAWGGLRPKTWVKGLKESDAGGGGCNSAVVASERVSFRAAEIEEERGRDSDERRCRRLVVESCALRLAAIEGVCECARDSAGHSHGSVSWWERVVGVLKASLRSLRPATRVSIVPNAYCRLEACTGEGCGYLNEMDAKRREEIKKEKEPPGCFNARI